MMKKFQTWLIPLIGTVAIALTLAGCAAMQKNEVMDVEGVAHGGRLSKTCGRHP